MNKIYLIILFVLLFSCKENKTEFIESKTMSLYLVKNKPEDNLVLKKEINKFILKKSLKHTVKFFEYSSDTKYFIKNNETTGVDSRNIEMYQSKYGIAIFGFLSCKKKENKGIGVIRYYEKYGDYYTPDTLIYNCN